MRKFHVALIFCGLVINILFHFMYVRSKCDNISEWCNKNILPIFSSPRPFKESNAGSS